MRVVFGRKRFGVLALSVGLKNEHTTITTFAHEASLLMLVFGVLFVGPGIYMVEGHVGFGRWVVDFQDHLFGMHTMKGSLAVVLLAEGLCVFVPLIILGLAVRLITGRSLLELVRKKK